jgi:hypothetical protein
VYSAVRDGYDAMGNVTGYTTKDKDGTYTYYEETLVLSPTLLPRRPVTLCPHADVMGSRSAPSGGRRWKVAETEKPRTLGAAGASGYSSGT